MRAGANNQTETGILKEASESLNQQRVRVVKQMNPPEMRDINLEHHHVEEDGAGKDDQLDKGDKEPDLQKSNPSQKRKRTDGPSTPLLTPKKRICSEAKKKDPEEVPKPVQANPDPVQSHSKSKMPPSETRTLTRRTLPLRNVVQDIEKDSTEDKTKFSQEMDKPVKTVKDKESPSSSKHLQPYVLLPLLSLKASESQPTEDLSCNESQPTEEVSLQPSLKSRTRSRKTRNTEELPPKSHEEETANERRSRPTRSRVSIPENLSEKVSDEKDEEEKVSNEKDELVANKDEASTAMERNAGEETLPLLRRRGEGFRDPKTATTATTAKTSKTAKTVTTSTAATTASSESKQRNQDEVDVVSRRFRTRASELVPTKEESPLESLKSNLGKRKGRQTRKEENSKAEHKVKPLDLPTTSKQSEISSSAVKTPEVAADPILEGEKKPALKEGRQSRTCRTGGATIQYGKTASYLPEISHPEDGDAESLPTRTTRSQANLSLAVPQMVRMAEGKRIVVILNKALIAEAKKRYRQLNPRISLKRLTKRVGKMENEMKRLIARNELRGRLTFLLHIDLKKHEVSCMEVMKKDVIPEVNHDVENGLDRTEERRSKRESLEERNGGALERRRGRSSTRREVTPNQKKPEVTNSTTRTVQRLPLKQGSTKERIGRSVVCVTEKRQEGENDQEEENGGEMDLFYQICPLRPCSLTKGGPGQSCGRRGIRRGRKIQGKKRASDKRKETSLWQLARAPTNLTRGKLLALHAFTYDGSGVNLWDDDEDEDEEEEVLLKRAWRSSSHHQPAILSDLTNKGRGGKVSNTGKRLFYLILSFDAGAIPTSKET